LSLVHRYLSLVHRYLSLVHRYLQSWLAYKPQQKDCGDGFRSQFASIPWVAVWAVLPGALVTLTSEVGTDIGRQVLMEDIYGLDIMFGEKEHAHVRDIVLLGWVGSTVAARLLLALDGSRFVLSSGVDGSRFTSWR
jgi:hypothetical protein